MKNEHLVPVNVVDIVNRLKDSSIRENERMNYVLRLEAIREYCAIAISKNSSSTLNSFADSRRKNK
jgi:hypothetical protein